MAAERKGRAIALNYVLLTLDFSDGRQRRVCETVTFAPSAALTGASGQEIPGLEPIVVQDGAPVVRLLATDNPGVLPAGWTWTVTFAQASGVDAPGDEVSFSFALPYSAGPTRRLSDLIPPRLSPRTRTRRVVLAAGAAGVGAVATRALLPGPARVRSDAAAGSVPPMTGTLDQCARNDALPVRRTFITRFQGGDGFVLKGAAAGSGAREVASSGCAGQAATVVTRGDGRTYASLASASLSFDTNGKYLAVRYRLSSALATRALELEIASDPRFEHCYRWQFADRSDTLGAGYSYDDEWEQIFLSFADAAVVGRPRRGRMTAARLRVQDHGRPVTAAFGEISLVDEPAQVFPRGVATICFDDIYATQYSHARPVLQAHGYRATVAVIREAIGLDHSMSLEQLRSLQDDLGWEIGCHSDSLAVHRATDLGVPLPVMRSDLRSELAYLRRNGFRDDKVLAYPSGLWNPDVVAVARRNCHAGRLNAFRTQETFPPSNPYKLRACGSISGVPGSRSAAEVKAAIDMAAAHRSWLILIFHKIVTGRPAQRTECSLTDFQGIISHLAATGMKVRTIGQVMRLARSA